jgi:phosphatidylinositol kinase/protein kinase (PI-3  family)
MRKMYQQTSASFSELVLLEIRSLVSIITPDGVSIIDKILEFEKIVEVDEELVDNLAGLSDHPKKTLKETKNTTAVSVLKIIKGKLEGRDETQAKSRLSVSDQVHKLISEAVCPDRLSSMFEGWMSWI